MWPGKQHVLWKRLSNNIYERVSRHLEEKWWALFFLGQRFQGKVLFPNYFNVFLLISHINFLLVRLDAIALTARILISWRWGLPGKRVGLEVSCLPPLRQVLYGEVVFSVLCVQFRQSRKESRVRQNWRHFLLIAFPGNHCNWLLAQSFNPALSEHLTFPKHYIVNDFRGYRLCLIRPLLIGTETLYCWLQHELQCLIYPKYGLVS